MIQDTLTSLLTTERGLCWLAGGAAFVFGGCSVVNATLGLARKSEAGNTRYVTREELVLDTLFENGGGTACATLLSSGLYAYSVDNLAFSYSFWGFGVVWSLVSLVELYILTDKRMDDLPRGNYSVSELDEATKRVTRYNRLNTIYFVLTGIGNGAAALVGAVIRDLLVGTS